MYIKTTCEINHRIEIMKYYSANYGAPGRHRKEKRKRTPEEVAKQNLWIRRRELRRLIELNFHGGDLHVTLTCRKEERPEKEEAPKVIRKFRDRLRTAYQKQGWELKYIITCETGQRGAVHWHMIVNNVHSSSTSTSRLMKELWTRGRVYFSPLDEGGEYAQLAEYIIKETADRIEKEESIEKLSYTPSRNLIRPEVKKEKIRAMRWRKEPKAPPGYRVIPESVVNGTNKFTGLPYQHYTIEKIIQEPGWKGGSSGRRKTTDQYLHRGDEPRAADP